jgi:hypothetical protein
LIYFLPRKGGRQEKGGKCKKKRKKIHDEENGVRQCSGSDELYSSISVSELCRTSLLTSEASIVFWWQRPKPHH